MLAVEMLPYGGEVAGIVTDVLHHRAQVFQIEQQQAIAIGDFEHQRQYTLLHFVEIQHAPDQQRSHVGDGGAQRMPSRAEHIPKRHGVSAMYKILQLELFDTRRHFCIAAPGFAHPGQITFDV